MMMAKNQENTPLNIFLIVVAAAMAMVALPSTIAQAPMSSPGPGAPMIMAPAPSPSLDCVTPLFNMSDCLSFVESGSNLTKPDKPCCPEFAGLVDSNPICLCQLLGDPGKIGIPIDINKALKLPSVCNVQTPPVSLCSAIGIPVGVPMASDGAPSPTVSSGNMAPGASASSPTTMNNDNGGITIATTTLHFFASLAISIVINSF